MRSRYFVGAQIVLIGVLSVTAVKYTSTALEYNSKVNSLELEVDNSVAMMDKNYTDLKENYSTVTQNYGTMGAMSDIIVIYDLVDGLYGVDLVDCCVNYVDHKSGETLEVSKNFMKEEVDSIPASCNQLVFNITYKNLTSLFEALKDSKLNYDSIEINNNKFSAKITVSYSGKFTEYLGGE